ncbi:MAG: hypothetical protein CMJ30_00695 [Phycisphaerae bacterium]|nr:hypothetical protein [Phycisphaerae bacterium]
MGDNNNWGGDFGKHGEGHGGIPSGLEKEVVNEKRPRELRGLQEACDELACALGDPSLKDVEHEGANADGNQGGDHAKGDPGGIRLRASPSIMGVVQREGDRFASRTDRQAPLGGLVDVLGRKVTHSYLSIRPKPEFGRTMFHE